MFIQLLTPDRNDIAPHHRLQMYYGYAFESYCTSTCSPKQGPRNSQEGWGGDVDTNVQWCSVAKTKLADTRIVIGGEVDCVRGESRLTNTRVEYLLRGPRHLPRRYGQFRGAEDITHNAGTPR